MTFTLFDFQEQALAAEVKHRAEHPDETRLAIVLPTGTGKATILAERAKRFAEGEHDRMLRAYDVGVIVHGGRQRVLVIVHTNELVEQLANTVRFICSMSEFPISVGIVKAERDDITADIIIASRQTLEIPERRARIGDVGLVMVDECHIGYTAYVPIMQHFGCMDGNNPCSIHTGWASPDGGWIDCSPGCLGNLPHKQKIPALGFTATMERSDGAGLGQVWQDVVFTRDTSWAVRKGYLVQPIGYRLSIDVSSDEGGLANRVRDSFSMIPQYLDEQIAEGIAPQRIVEKWFELASDRQTIVFAPLVRSARAIATEFERLSNRTPGLDITVAVVHGDMPDALRADIIARFKAGEIQVLCNAMVLTAGFDHPDIRCVVVARPTKSRTLFVQMAGRGLRRVPGIPVEEQDCILISLADGTDELCSHVDLSDRPLPRDAEGALTVMEDEWDIGKHLDDQARHWTGRVDATQFDPLVARSSKVWQRTKAGHWFVPISTEREYVFLVGTSIYVLTRIGSEVGRMNGVARTARLHSNLPDVETAMRVAEDEATDRGGDLGALVADRTRPWRNKVPKPGDKMLAYAYRLGLDGEVERILASKSGGKAGKVSDLIRRVEASRSIDRMVINIKEKSGVSA